MSNKYFPSLEDGNNFNVNLNLSAYATKDDLKDLTNVDTSSFALKLNLGHLKDKVDVFFNNYKKNCRCCFFNGISLSIATLRSMNNKEINEYIKSTVLKNLADIVDGITRDPLGYEAENIIKTLINEFRAKITDNIIKKEGGLIVKSTLDTELKKINDEMKVLVSKADFNISIAKLTLTFFNIMNSTDFENAARNVKKEGGLVTKNQLTTVENTLVSKEYLKTLLNHLKSVIGSDLNNVTNNGLSAYIEALVKKIG